jgi:lipopolysaccharide/colanic/teichoic acid biosynthesis glycosyltransferase
MRVASLDELPELWNVIKGEMSLVGPRPLREEYLLYYTEREQLRHDALPGISGLAQVSGRNLLRWEDRLELDVQYVEQVSFALDLWIIWKTLAVVFRRQGAAPDSAAVGETRLDEERGAKLP